uniref:Glycosyltransferase 2-like domain-containing protein n=1 Tax=viral metagenome TaxID=1070528 RepID=A0A6C0DJV8_9ZZZZ
MGKKPSNSKNFVPMVSVCTPTFNRRPFIQTMFECFRNQTYPKNRIEWIIVDDGTDKIRDLIEKADIPQIRYIEVKERMNLGAKRNYMHSFVKGNIVVYMDDDDYYPPDRISHAVETLQANPNALCAGSSEIYIYFKHVQKMIQCGPYGPNHATAGTFAFRSELLNITKYEDHAALAEERAFLKEYTIPFVQLDPMKSILVFSHEHNTFDKRKMFNNSHPDYFKESTKTVDDFIKFTSESKIKKFFMKDIDKLLEKYEPGHPNMKPEALKQIKEIEAKRDQMIKEEMEKQRQQGQQNGPILLQRPGEAPVELSQQDIVNIMTQQQQHIQQCTQRITELDNVVAILQTQLAEKIKTIQTLQSSKPQSGNDTTSATATNNSNNEIILKIMTERNRELEMRLSNIHNELSNKEKTIQTLQSSQNQTPQNTNHEAISKIMTERNTELEKSITNMRKLLQDKNSEIDELNIKILNLKIDKMDNENNESSKQSYTRIPIEVVDSAQFSQEVKSKPKTKSDPEFIIDISM